MRRLLVVALVGLASCKLLDELGKPKPPKGPFSAIWLEGDHACARVASGDVTCWGGPYKFGARLVPEMRNRPARAPAKTAACHGETCRIDAAGNIECKLDWNVDWKRQPGIANAVDIVAGDNHKCALTKDGAVWCWGIQSGYQLGDGTTDTHYEARPVGGLAHVVEIAAAKDGTCVRLADGDMRCWGSSPDGQLSPSGDFGPFKTPTSVTQ